MPPQPGLRVFSWLSHIQHCQWNHPTDRKGKKGGMPLFCNLPPPDLALSFLFSPPLVVGYKTLLPWKCKRLCQHWLGWTWWKQPKDGPSADLPTLCMKFFPGLISQVANIVEEWSNTRCQFRNDHVRPMLTRTSRGRHGRKERWDRAMRRIVRGKWHNDNWWTSVSGGTLAPSKSDHHKNVRSTFTVTFTSLYKQDTIVKHLWLNC